MIITIVTGFIAGVIHVVSGPDHIAAVAPFAAQKKENTWNVGFFWGIGHTGGVWLVGILALLLREILPLELISSWSERLVGVVLIGIGLWGIRRALKTKIHYHEHEHDESGKHGHFHFHYVGEDHHQTKSHEHTHAPLGVGILHGLAGSSHFLGILPALMLPTQLDAAAYILFFGVGSIIAMSLFSFLIGLFTRKMVTTLPAYKGMLLTFAFLAIGVGVVWLVI
jgi:ABC-type nickel/cobalt efflux system permease component RcnA